MEKISLDNLKATKLLNDGLYSRIYLLDDGKIFKMFSCFVTDNEIFSKNIEEKILISDQFKKLNNLVLPLEIVYSPEGLFLGYTMDCYNEIPIADFYNSLTLRDKLNIEKINNIYQNICLSIKTLNNEEIIAPDLCTYGNVLIDKKLNVKITDYDGLQIKDHFSMEISSTLGNQQQYLSKKYLKSDDVSMIYTDNIDKKSLALLFFSYFFGMDMEKTVDYYKKNGYPIDICIKSVLNYHNVNDEELLTLSCNLYDYDKDNSYFDEIANKITVNNDLSFVKEVNNIVSKKLIKKR